MYQIEDFIENAVRTVAMSGLGKQEKRNLIYTLFEMEEYGDCSFTNLRTISEMIECSYSFAFDAKEMYNYTESPELYDPEQCCYNRGDVYYDPETDKFCIDSGSKAWEEMIKIGAISGEGACPVDLLPHIEVFKQLKSLMGDMDQYTLEGYRTLALLTGAFSLSEPTDKFKNKYRIPSARANWHSYDGGMYFITVCTAKKEHYFGEIVNAEMQLNELGKYLEEQIMISSQIRPNMDLEIPLFVIMPNHIHLIVVIGGGGGSGCGGFGCGGGCGGGGGCGCGGGCCRDAMHCVSTGTPGTPTTPTNKFGPQSKNLASVIRGIKIATTTFARKNNIPFEWQTRFHDHIIRNQEECNRIADYIENNPAKWDSDINNISKL